MREVKKVKTALRAVERWEEYLFRRAVGINFIVWAALFAGAGIITLKLGPMVFTWLVVVVAGLFATVYLFASAGLTIAQKKPLAPTVVRRRDILMAMMGSLAVLVLLFSAAYFGGYLGYPVALLLFLGIVGVVTYYTGRRYPEQLIFGIVLVATSPLIYVLGTGDVAYMSALALIALTAGAGGVYSLLAARRALIEKKQPRAR